MEIVVADSRADAEDRSRPGLRHLLCPGDHTFALRRKALAAARNEWILLIEDHTWPMPDLIEQVREAIAANPQADLIAGGVENFTSRTIGSWSHFLYTAYAFWPPSRRKARLASIANLLVRRSALRPEELARDCGFELATMPRLAAARRQVLDKRLRVDHVQEGTLLTHCVAHFHNARCQSAYERQFGRSLLRSIAAEMLYCAYAIMAAPLRILHNVRGTPQFKLAHWPCLVVIGAAASAGRLWGLSGREGTSPYMLD